MQYCYFPLKCHVDTFQIGIKVCHICVLRIIEDATSMHPTWSIPVSFETPLARAHVNSHIKLPNGVVLPYPGLDAPNHNFKELSVISSTQLNASMVVLHLIKTVATQSQLHTGKCPTSFLYIKNTLHHIITSGTSSTPVPCFQCRLSCIP